MRGELKTKKRNGDEIMLLGRKPPAIATMLVLHQWEECVARSNTKGGKQKRQPVISDFVSLALNQWLDMAKGRW